MWPTKPFSPTLLANVLKKKKENPLSFFAGHFHILQQCEI
jgi:hypothetical protein